jgi:hypothetical protein
MKREVKRVTSDDVLEKLENTGWRAYYLKVIGRYLLLEMARQETRFNMLGYGQNPVFV